MVSKVGKLVAQQSCHLVKALMAPDPIVVFERKQNHHTDTAHSQDDCPQQCRGVAKPIETKHQQVRQCQAEYCRQRPFGQLDHPHPLTVQLQGGHHPQRQTDGILGRLSIRVNLAHRVIPLLPTFLHRTNHLTPSPEQSQKQNQQSGPQRM